MNQDTNSYITATEMVENYTEEHYTDPIIDEMKKRNYQPYSTTEKTKTYSSENDAKQKITLKYQDINKRLINKVQTKRSMTLCSIY